ncbi:hypothetical protein BGZ80_005921, partial [Entomortierella chlamydospora]
MHARSFITIVLLALCAFSATLASPIPHHARGGFSAISRKLAEVHKKRLISAQADVPTDPDPDPPPLPTPTPNLPISTLSRKGKTVAVEEEVVVVVVVGGGGGGGGG